MTFADLRRQLLGDPEARRLMDLILDGRSRAEKSIRPGSPDVHGRSPST